MGTPAAAMGVCSKLLTKTVYSCVSVFKASTGENVQGNLHVMLWSLFEAGLYIAL